MTEPVFFERPDGQAITLRSTPRLANWNRSGDTGGARLTRALGDVRGPGLLALIPELRVNKIDVSCSGMAGTYGLNARNLPRSLAAGRLDFAADALAHALLFDGGDDQGLLVQGRLRALVEIAPRVGATAGVTWNVRAPARMDVTSVGFTAGVTLAF